MRLFSLTVGNLVCGHSKESFWTVLACCTWSKFVVACTSSMQGHRWRHLLLFMFQPEIYLLIERGILRKGWKIWITGSLFVNRCAPYGKLKHRWNSCKRRFASNSTWTTKRMSYSLLRHYCCPYQLCNLIWGAFSVSVAPPNVLYRLELNLFDVCYVQSNNVKWPNFGFSLVHTKQNNPFFSIFIVPCCKI